MSDTSERLPAGLLNTPFVISVVLLGLTALTLGPVTAWMQVALTKEAIPLFLEDLKNQDPVLRLAAYNSFRAFFIEFPPPFDATASETVRVKQVAAILDWYREQ